MTPEQWKRVRAIFEAALDQPAEARVEFLHQACADDPELLQQTLALMRAHDTDGEFMKQPARLEPGDLQELPEGTMLGPYRIVRTIGSGGMGIVYLAYDRELERQVALKALPAYLSASPDLRERLRREARAAANIKHSSIAIVHALREIDGHLFIDSEYVSGTTLRLLLKTGPLEPSRALAIALKIASALSAAHAAGVTHRDLKPENIIITATGDVKVVDFGIAHIDAPDAPRLTKDGVVIGTPGYMPPEQLAGGPVDPRTDIYAFGIVFREMLTGRRTASTTLTEASIPSRLMAIIDTCVQLQPEARYASGRELMRALADEPHGAADPTAPATVGSPRWWWEFHQATTAIVYWVMTWPAWTGRQIIGGPVGRALFIATLIGVIVAATLRLHLWFTSRFYPAQLRWARRRVGVWVRAADWLFVVSLAASGVTVGEDRSPVAIVLIAVAVGSAIAFLVIERATTRAAFRTVSALRD
jgi:hypothetical protein